MSRVQAAAYESKRLPHCEVAHMNEASEEVTSVIDTLLNSRRSGRRIWQCRETSPPSLAREAVCSRRIRPRGCSLHNMLAPRRCWCACACCCAASLPRSQLSPQPSASQQLSAVFFPTHPSLCPSSLFPCLRHCFNIHSLTLVLTPHARIRVLCTSP